MKIQICLLIKQLEGNKKLIFYLFAILSSSSGST
jgi:hypothetical protein